MRCVKRAVQAVSLLVTAIVTVLRTMPWVSAVAQRNSDIDADGICDDADNCTDVAACNYDDPANGSCQVNDECGVCGGTGLPCWRLQLQ